MPRITYAFLLFVLLLLGACKQQNPESTLQKCGTLAGESIIYARANYVKLFHYYNPNKFFGPFQRIKDFDHVKHRNVINTYDIAVRKLKPHDPVTDSFISSCLNLSKFSQQLVDQTYPRAIAHQSQYDPHSDNFFIEINNIVKFDHTIGEFERAETSFKNQVEKYQKAAKAFLEKFKTELPIQGG